MGHEIVFTIVSIPDETARVIESARARLEWQRFYRAVRTLRKLRQGDDLEFARMSYLWWKGSLESEYFNAGIVNVAERRARYKGKVGESRVRRLP